MYYFIGNASGTIFRFSAGFFTASPFSVKLLTFSIGPRVSDRTVINYLSSQSERVSYDEFKDWLISHPDATTVTRWLLAEPCHVSLSNDLETPTFYQTLAGVTHCE